MPCIEAIAIINNAVSADLTRQLIEIDGIPLSRVGLVQLRDVNPDWATQCAGDVTYGARPAHTMLGQRRFARFYRRGARFIKEAWAAGDLREVYVVNNDNLLTSPLFLWKRSDHPTPRLTVVAEGIMNYQQISTANRADWRWRVKPLVARALGLPYRIPTGHLSGAFEDAVSRTVSFTDKGLRSPSSKVTVLPLPRAPVNREPDARTCLILHTGLWQWMAPDAYATFAAAFASWLDAQEFERILAKAHPRVGTGPIEQLLPPHEMLTDDRSVEALASEVPAATVVGTCCTALATLKLMRPDIRCVDFGADFYCTHAYQGDTGVVDFLHGAGVEVQPSGLGQPEREL